jgi:hypothetical protein
MPETETQYSYFVSFAHMRGFGNTEIRTSLPVTTWADVQLLARLATNGNTAGGPVVVLHYVLLSGPSDQATASV